MRVYLFAATLLAVSSACAIASPSSQPALNAVKIETWLWGTQTESWLVEANGTVTNTAVDKLFVQPITHSTIVFTMPPSDVAAFAARLQPVRDLLPSGISCDGPLATDQGSTIIEWKQESGAITLLLDHGCRSAKMTIAQTALDDVMTFIETRKSTAH